MGRMQLRVLLNCGLERSICIRPTRAFDAACKELNLRRAGAIVRMHEAHRESGADTLPVPANCSEDRIYLKGHIHEDL
jgi:hypothetical protein